MKKWKVKAWILVLTSVATPMAFWLHEASTRECLPFKIPNAKEATGAKGATSGSSLLEEELHKAKKETFGETNFEGGLFKVTRHVLPGFLGYCERLSQNQWAEMFRNITSVTLDAVAPFHELKRAEGKSMSTAASNIVQEMLRTVKSIGINQTFVTEELYSNAAEQEHKTRTKIISLANNLGQLSQWIDYKYMFNQISFGEKMTFDFANVIKRMHDPEILKMIQKEMDLDIFYYAVMEEPDTAIIKEFEYCYDMDTCDLYGTKMPAPTKELFEGFVYSKGLNMHPYLWLILVDRLRIPKRVYGSEYTFRALRVKYAYIRLLLQLEYSGGYKSQLFELQHYTKNLIKQFVDDKLVGKAFSELLSAPNSFSSEKLQKIQAIEKNYHYRTMEMGQDEMADIPCTDPSAVSGRVQDIIKTRLKTNADMLLLQDSAFLYEFKKLSDRIQKYGNYSLFKLLEKALEAGSQSSLSSTEIGYVVAFQFLAKSDLLGNSEINDQIATAVGSLLTLHSPSDLVPVERLIRIIEHCGSGQAQDHIQAFESLYYNANSFHGVVFEKMGNDKSILENLLPLFLRETLSLLGKTMQAFRESHIETSGDYENISEELVKLIHPRSEVVSVAMERVRYVREQAISMILA